MAKALAESAPVKDAMDVEQRYAGTIDTCTSGHRANSANLYLVSTKNHPSFGLSFYARAFKTLDRQAYEALLADEKERKAHKGRGGEDHDVAVYITSPQQTPGGIPRVYIFDPENWPKPPSKEEIKAAKEAEKRGASPLKYKRRELSNASMVHRVHELLNHLKNGQSARDKALKRAEIYIYGGGNEASDCRTMALRWAVDVFCTQIMELDGANMAAEPPRCFEAHAEEATWVKIGY